MNWMILIELIPILLGIFVIIFNKKLVKYYDKFYKEGGYIFPKESRNGRLIIIACILILFGLVGLIETLS